MLFGCKHKWEVINEVTTESMFEHAMKVARDKGCTKMNLPHQLCDGERKHILTVKCDGCGKIKQLVNTI